jgi:ribonuclease J
LVDFGAEVITDRDALVHTSGHPRRDELRQMYDWVRPQIVVPVHGEALHLHEQAKVARAAGVPQVIETRNGQMIRLAPGRAEKLETVPSGRLYRDGRLLVSHEESGVGERRRLAFAGLVSVAVVLSDSGDVLEDPAITLLGLPRADREGEELQGVIEDAVDEVLDGLPKPKRRDGGLVREALRRAVRGSVDIAWGKKPAVIVHVVHVSD